MRLLLDLKLAARTAVRSRFVSVLAVIAFALGIGVTTAVFSIFNGVLLQPLPYPNPEQLVAVYDTQPACATCPASFPKFHDWRERNQVFSAIGGSSQQPSVLTGQGDPARVSAVMTTASLAEVFGVKPQIGRWYTEDEDRPGGPKVVVLMHDFWSQRFGRDPGVVGRTILLDGEPYEVVGVMPPGFTHRRADVLVPLQRKLDPATRGSHFLVTYARLKPGVTREQAAAALRPAIEDLRSRHPDNFPKQWTLRLAEAPAAATVLGEARRMRKDGKLAEAASTLRASTEAGRQSCDSSTPSTCATACFTTLPRRFLRAGRST